MNNFKFIPKEIKEQILARIKNEGVTVSEAAKDHGINVRTIYGWLKKQSTKGISVLEYARLKRENRILLEMVGRLTLERAGSGRSGKKG